METKQIAPCIFCGKGTKESHETSIGVLHIHSDCLVDLEEVLSIKKEDLQPVGS